MTGLPDRFLCGGENRRISWSLAGKGPSQEDQGMTTVRSMYGRVRSAMGIFGSAARVAGALENRVKPGPADMRRIGMDPHAFLSIGLG